MKDKTVIPNIIVCLMLVLAVLRLPYDYYKVLRWVVFVISIHLALFHYSSKNIIWPLILGLIALIFNPLIPFRFDKEIWTFINLGSALVLGVEAFSGKR